VNRSPLIWVLLAIIIGAGIWLYPRDPYQKNAFAARELATRKLAEHLAAKFPGQRALIVSNPYVPMGVANSEIKKMESDGIAGLKSGMGDKLACDGVVYPELTAEAKSNPGAVLADKETITPLSFLMADDAFDKLVAKYPQCDLIFSVIGLPDNIEDLQCWRAEGKPAFALLLPDLRLLGRAAIQRALKRGKIAAFVMNKPGAPDSRAPVSSDPHEFDKRFIMVTADNIDETIRTYPHLFP
jgi:hypothetical protein